MNVAALSDPVKFRQSIRIEVGGQLVPFKPDEFQIKDFEALDDAWLLAAGRQPRKEQPVRWGWLERPRGHAKTQDISLMAVWCLLAASYKVRGIALSGDERQAQLIRDRIDDICRCNPQIAALLEIQSSRVLNTRSGSELIIISSSVATGFGFWPQFLLADEVSHWERRNLWAMAFTTVGKLDHCCLVAALNAGWQRHWSYEYREKYRNDPAWYFASLRGPCASWITDRQLDAQRRGNLEQDFSRLWLNQWQSGDQDSVFAEADIQACIDPNVIPLFAE